MLKNKKLAAMFGLDARIALAIFGALSVITGASLYSTLSYIEVKTFANELNEIGKAWEAYYLDIGLSIPPSGRTSPAHVKYYKQAFELVESSENNWKVPYLAYKKYSPTTTREPLAHPKFKQISLFIANNKDWTNWSDIGLCSSTIPCFLWIRISLVPIDLAEEIDKFIDGEISYSKGDVRILTVDAKNVSLFYNYNPTKFEI